MNSFERTRASLKFSCPDKVPIMKGIKGDIITGFSLPSNKWKPGWREEEKGLFPHTYLQFWNWDEPEWISSNPNYRDGKWTTVFAAAVLLL